jgi:apolipoprotein N-acyltransferase
VALTRTTALQAFAALLASAIMLYFGTGLHPIWWLTWIGAIPVLWISSRISRRGAFVIAFLACAIQGLNLWSYFRNSLSMPLIVTLLIVMGPALIFAVGVLLHRWLVQKSLWSGALILPSFWVSYEFLEAMTSPHSTAGNLAYTQMNFLPVIQVASVTGIWAISFCIFLFASTAAVLLGRVGRVSDRCHLAIGVSCVLLAVLGFGAWRLRTIPPAKSTVMIGLLASDLRQNILAEQPSDTLRLLHDYSAQAELLADKGARVIVVPEKIAVLLDPNLEEADSLLRSTATKTGALIVVGVIHPTIGAKWNEARLYFPDGSIRTYEKHHMLPVYEGNLTVGTRRTEWKDSSGLLGVTICKDMDFPALSREYGTDGVGLLLVPAWDFRVDGWWHGRMAILRGVESGFSIARSPKEGILSVTNNRGRVLAESTTDQLPFSTLVAAVPLQNESTFYDRFGDWFGCLNLLLFVGLIASSFGGRPRPATS